MIQSAVHCTHPSEPSSHRLPIRFQPVDKRSFLVKDCVLTFTVAINGSNEIIVSRIEGAAARCSREGCARYLLEDSKLWASFAFGAAITIHPLPLLDSIVAFG